MRRILCTAALLLLARAAAAGNFTVRVHETATIDLPGTTAAYAIDATIADVSVARAGAVSVTGRTAGTTQLIAVTPAGTKAYLITVAAPVPARIPGAVTAGAPIARVESRYSSGSSQVQSSVDVFTDDGDRRSQFHLLNVHYLRDAFDRPSNVFPSVFYRLTTPHRELTLLDDFVDLSPLTIRSASVRGLHLRQGPLELHGGYAASTQYEDLFLPADRRWLASASYAVEGGGVRWIPSVHAFFSEPRGTGARRGVVGSLAAEHRSGDALFARGEVAVSRSLAAAGQVRYETAVDVLRASAWHKPDDFPTLRLADVPGTHGELDWSRRATKRLTVDSYAAYDRLLLSGSSQSVGIANVLLRYAVSPHVSMLGGGEASIYRRPSSSSRTIGIPLGVSVDWPSFGASVSYRILDTSNAGRRGDTLRLSARANAGIVHVNAWAERQRQAPTLDLIFREEPALELALLRLGISVRTPQDLARVLRDNAVLINLDFIEGVSINLTPRRVQAGFDVGVVSPGARDRLRLHAVFDRTEGVGSTADSQMAILTYSRRFLDATDLYGSFTWWHTNRLALANDGTAVEVGVRQRFDGVPAFLRRSGSIEGVVFLDPEMRGVRGEGTTPLPGIEVMLDESQTVRTDASGAYVFRDVKPGRHRVSARLSASRPAFFTSPSRVEVEVPGRADFGLVWTPARSDGRVVSDANLGIAGAVVAAAAANGKPITTTSDSEGTFVIATQPGQYTVTLAPESLPPGYTISGESSRTVTATPDQSQSVTFELRALRSIAGTAPGASVVRIEPLGRTATTDAAGNFVFRSLPAGTFTLTAAQGGRAVTRSVTLPAEPTTLRDITLGDRALSETAPAPASSVAAVPIAAGAFHVQAGAFRSPSNAESKRRQLERMGYHPETTRSGALHILSIGPFATRAQAAEESARLNRAGIENVIVADHPPQVATSNRNGSFFLQLGAFRETANARQLIRRLGRLGQQTEAVNQDGLTLVHAGPFASRSSAKKTSEQLRRAGFESIVTKR